MKFSPALIFVILCTSFIIYSFSIYLIPLSIDNSVNFDKKKATDGKIVWQKYNCQNCHQLYGLGGYLGPDLTNIYSNKGEIVIRTFIKSGIKQMPSFNLKEEDFSNLIEFLKSVDESGKSDPRKLIITNVGMIK
jgi:nitric oxide reductase subunit C